VKQIIKNYLKKVNYFQEEYKKTQIVLHHTETTGWRSPFKWWSRKGNHVATAYIIDKDGTIIECFDPKHWAYNTGLGAKYDKHNIGIELVNEGYLRCTNEDEGRFKYRGKYNYKYKIGFSPKVLTEEWRGHKYFAKYTTEQIKSTFELVKKLCNDFDIRTFIAPKHIYNEQLRNFRGIITHANVKQNKTDISPAFPIEGLDGYLEFGKKKKIEIPKVNWFESLINLIFSFFSKK
jgi:N-acetyl-anhydromuramyl-L-alanine amidase AmpD